MDAPTLQYDPRVDDFGCKTFITETFKEITYDEALLVRYYRRQALQPNRSTLPAEFTQYVLRHLAISERGCCHFEKKLDPEIREYLKKLTGLKTRDVCVDEVHAQSTDKPTGFRGIFAKYFLRKVIYNVRNENGRFEYAENFASVFPFKVSPNVEPIDVEIFDVFNDEFYHRVQSFLDEHFDGEVARDMVRKFIWNVYHFKSTKFSEIELVSRLKREVFDEEVDLDQDYLSTFPRLNKNGISWMKKQYMHYQRLRKIFEKIEEPLDDYTEFYFQTLPETNFVDLYDLLSPSYYRWNSEKYFRVFSKYLFFFAHALKEESNPVFFIDDVLFECLKSLHKVKTSREDLSLFVDIAKLSLIQLRTKYDNDIMNLYNAYTFDLNTLQNIKEYLLKLPNIENVQLDVEYRTDYLHGWMLFRIDDVCYETCYSRRDRIDVENFLDRILCSVLSSDDEPIKKVVIYNAFKGQQTVVEMPQNIETLRNFVRLTNTYNFDEYNDAEATDAFLTRDLETYFEHLSIDRN